MTRIKKLKTPLSGNLHVAIRQAVADVMACRKDERYEIDMNHYWHTPIVGKCHVCLAGAAIARRTTARPQCDVEELYVNGVDMADTLNMVREGDIEYACDLCGLEIVSDSVPRYVREPMRYPEDDNETDVQKWRANMLRIADWVEKNCKPEGD